LRRFQAAPGDREVLHGALRLRPPQGVGGYPYLAHGVAFDPVLGHGPIVPRPRPGPAAAPPGAEGEGRRHSGTLGTGARKRATTCAAWMGTGTRLRQQ